MPVFNDKEVKEKLKVAIKESIKDYLKSEMERSSLTTYKSVLSLLVGDCYTEISDNVCVENSLILSEVTEKFSGRGKSWVKINNDSSLWEIVISVLKSNITSKDNCLDYIDRFEELGFAYLRYYRTNKFNSMFEIRVFGCLRSSNVKVNFTHKDSLNLEFLEGTPISVGLEVSDRNNLATKKKLVIEEESVDLEFPFQKISDII
jgi:hypothetical protein